ncbi:hypothetical protein RQP46_001764 [Phenoliferia psychrophenolica]
MTPVEEVHAHNGDPFHPPGGILHVKSTILWGVLPEVLFFSAIATGVCAISDYVHPLHIAPTLLTVFGTVLGFIVSYRTSSAYERYSEGRKLWGQVTLASRTFARIAWIHVPTHHTAVAPGQKPDEEEVLRALIEKKSVINLCGAFNVALKHYLRGEGGIYYKDLYPLICWIPKYALPAGSYVSRPDLDASHRQEHSHPSESMELLTQQPMMSMRSSQSSNDSSFTASKPPFRSNTAATWTSTATYNAPLTASPVCGAPSSTTRQRRIIPPKTLLPSRNPPHARLEDWIPWYGFVRDVFFFCTRRVKKASDRARGRKKRRKPIAHTSNDNIPLEITLLLSGYITQVANRGLTGVPTLNSLLAAVQSLSEALTGLERVLLTPIPVAYSLHLRHTIWIYLFLFPSQIHASLGWTTVPATAIATFVFLGFIQIGQEIESPFGYDDNDLDLEVFCTTIIRELRELTAHPPSEALPENFCFVDTNLGVSVSISFGSSCANLLPRNRPLATPPLYEGLSAVQMVNEPLSPEEFHAGLKSGAKGIGPELHSETSRPDKPDDVV